MGETEKKEPGQRIKNPDLLGEKGDLPDDLLNSIGSVIMALQFYGGGKNPDKIRENIREVQTFDEYYREIAKKYSDFEVKNNGEPFDIDASVSAQREVIIQREAIAHFDKSIAELKAMADSDTIDEDRVSKIIFEDIYPLFGKKS